jgi:hypothetical protein
MRPQQNPKGRKPVPETSSPSVRPRRALRTTLAAAAAAIGTLVLAPSAFGIGFTNLSSAPADTSAGANSNFTMHVEFTTPGDDIKNIRIGLPPGQIGDPNAAPKCTVAQLEGAGCAANTRVGDVSTSISISGLPQTVTGGLFNLVAQPGEPARFGIRLSALPLDLPILGEVLLPPIILQSGVELRQTDFGLDTVINGIPNTATLLDLLGIPITVPIDITAMDVTLRGSGPEFSRNPTSCSLKTTNFSATSYSGATTVTPATGQASYTPTNCAAVPFSPTFSATAGGAGQTAQGQLTTVSTAIDQDPGEAGLKDAVVLTPPDFGPNIAALNDTCSPADFQAGNCSQASEVGSALATSPLLTQPLAGPVVLIDQEELPLIGLDLQGELNMKLTGSLSFNNQVTFNGLPDIPIAHFALTFSGPPDGLLFANRDLCQPPAPLFTGSFTSHSGIPDVPFAQGATIEGCGPQAAGPINKAKKCKKKGRKKGKGRKSDDATASKRKKQKKCKKKGRKKRKGKK